MAVNDIRDRLRLNLGRVQQLIGLYESVGSTGSPPTSDVLRAAIVFLHATLEDVIRSTLELRLPSASPEHLAMLGFAVGEQTKKNISMSELATHRGKSIDELISERIEAHLKESNFNNVRDLVHALERSSIDKSLLDPYKKELAGMMRRRHLIVHRADRDPKGPGHAQVDAATVTSWKDVVDGFCSTVVGKLEAS